MVDTSSWWDSIPPGLTLEIQMPFVIPNTASGIGYNKKPRNDIQAEPIGPSISLHCPDKCIFIANSFEELEDHVTFGIHRLSSTDMSVLKWAQKLETVSETIRKAKQSRLCLSNAKSQVIPNSDDEVTIVDDELRNRVKDILFM